MVKARVARPKNIRGKIATSVGLVAIGFFGMVGIFKYIDTLPVAFAQSQESKPVDNQATEKESSVVSKPREESKPQNKPTNTKSESSARSIPNANASTSAATVSAQTSIQLYDQFSGASLDTSQWEAMSLPKAYRNNEEQLYAPDNVTVGGGMLRINAIRGSDGQWRSGEVHSKWRYKYGDFEVRLALDKVGQGVWPAAWLLGDGAQWPNAGEIDIFENINTDPMAFATIHGGGSGGHWMSQKWLWGYKTTDFHTYKISKSPGVISWWVDGVKMKEWTKANTLAAGQVWPFEDYSNMGILNLALGGKWPGPTNGSTPESITMMVDYFKITNAS
jgi:beta-glucanase (GH16 family)